MAPRKPKNPETPEKRFETFRSANYASVYANSAQVRTTIWDIAMVFGELVTTPDSKQVQIEEKIRVVMSLTHAKALLAVLQRDLKAYEEQFGPIWEPQQNQAEGQ